MMDALLCHLSNMYSYDFRNLAGSFRFLMKLGMYVV